jgi:hypothetical protein
MVNRYSVLDLEAMIWPVGSRIRILIEGTVFYIVQKSRTALGPTQASVQYVSGFSPGFRGTWE